jgi:hypothetical protein
MLRKILPPKRQEVTRYERERERVYSEELYDTHDTKL